MTNNSKKNDNNKEKKPPRKISCLPCRTKKAKCDGGIPHCNRCIRNSRENKCIYPKPRTFGRPPKNAVLHKNQDTVPPTKSPIATSTSTPTNDNSICREFIFENQYDIKKNTRKLSIQEQQQEQQQLIISTAKKSPQLMKFAEQILDIERIFSLYIARGSALREKLSDFDLNPTLKLKTLHQHFTWLTSSMINITIKRSCQFIEMNSHYDPEITLTAFMREEDVNIFFFNLSSCDSGNNNNSVTTNNGSSSNGSNTNKPHNNKNYNTTITNTQQQQSSPLDSIPTDQAIQLIDYFFQLHPYCILLNKTKVLQDYWNDSIEPLLLCTIYGITIYTCQQALKGKAFVLWAINRNPFLNYAYILLEKFFLKRDQYQPHNTPSTLGNYQATVILGIFETLFGFSKHGMTIISLSYMMASDLGVFSNNQDEKKRANDKLSKMDLIDRELLINTYWAALRATAYGCIELGLYLREALLFHGQPFPPANIQTSASYQYDLLHNNHSSSSYLIESFHTEMIITYFSSKLFACLPKTELNLFGCPTTPPNPPTIEELLQQQYRVLLHLLDAAQAASSQYATMVDYQVQRVLDDFKEFIDQEKYQWSCFQTYMIETTYYLYSIHFKFIKNQNDIAPIRYQKIIEELDLYDVKAANRIRQLLPTTIQLIRKLQAFLYENDDIDDSEDENAIALLPLGPMMAALETSIQLMMYHYQLDRDNIEIERQLKQLYFISKRSIWNHCGSVVKSITKKLKEFLRDQHISITGASNQQQQYQQQRRASVAAATLVQPPEIYLINAAKDPNAHHEFVSSVNGAGLNNTLFLDASQLPAPPQAAFSTGSSSAMSITSTNSSSMITPSPMDFCSAVDDSFLQEFDDIFQRSLDVNVPLSSEHIPLQQQEEEQVSLLHHEQNMSTTTVSLHQQQQIMPVPLQHQPLHVNKCK